MAQRRMFSLKVTDTDAFCEMPATAQNLYFHIGMRADDDGFYAGVKGLMAKIHASIDDLNILLARHFLLDRGEGVYVVKHWKMNNYLQSDRYQPTEYQEKKIGLYTKPDGSYTLDPNKAKPKCIQNVSIGKVSIGKDSVVESSEVKNSKEEISTEDSSIPSSVSKEDSSKKETKPNEWVGLNSHQIVDKFVEKKFIRDDETTRNAFLELIQTYIDHKDFCTSLEAAVHLAIEPLSSNDCSLKLAKTMSMFKTLMGDRGRNEPDDEPF